MIDQHPQIVEVDARLAEVQAREDLFRQGVLEAHRQYRTAEETYLAGRDKALDSGRAPTLQKPVPSITAEEQTARLLAFQREREALQEERRRVVVDIGPDIRQEAHEARDRILTEARQHVRALDALAKSMREAQQAVTDVELAKAHFDRMDPKIGGQQIKPPDPASPESLIQAIRFGSDPLHVGIPRKLGFADSTLQKMPDSAWEPATPAG